MESKQEADRQNAVQRYLNGESSSTICASLGHSRQWFYKWVKRHEAGGIDWFRDQSRCPHESPKRFTWEVAEIVAMVRLSLYNSGVFCGAQAIRWEMEEQGVNPLPSTRTISRILVRKGLTHRRTGRYEPKGVKYPSLTVDKPGIAQQMDLVGPCYLKSKVRFYSMNSVDVAIGMAAVEPVMSKSGQDVVNGVWALWCRLGLPRHLQIDNEMTFYGSPGHPRCMGNLIRLCLLNGVEPWFIPPSEPWRNGIVEKFNDHWRQKFLRKVTMSSEMDLQRESLGFEQRHNSRCHYSKLGGKTPLAALQNAGGIARFPPTSKAPQYPLPKPATGCYHLIRFIRSEGVVDVFGEKFLAPSETIYEYIRATIDVEKQRLKLYLDDKIVAEHNYRLR